MQANRAGASHWGFRFLEAELGFEIAQDYRANVFGAYKLFEDRDLCLDSVKNHMRPLGINGEARAVNTHVPERLVSKAEAQ